MRIKKGGTLSGVEKMPPCGDGYEPQGATRVDVLCLDVLAALERGTETVL